MSKHFEEALVLIRVRHEDNLKRQLEGVFAKNAHDGMLYSGNTVIRCRNVASREITDFSNSLIRKLTDIEPDHSPIKLKDFEKARLAIIDFKSHAESTYRTHLARLDRAMPTGLIDEPFKEAGASMKMALSDLEAKRAEFQSRRSHVKTALIWAKNNPVPVVSFILVATIIGLSAVVGVQAPDWLLQVLGRN